MEVTDYYSWSSDSPVMHAGKENEQKQFKQEQKPMVVTPVKSPLLEAWHSGKKKRHQNSVLSQGPIRIPTPTKAKRFPSPDLSKAHFNKSPLRVPVAMETSSLKSVKKPSSPRFATPTKASKAAAAFVAANLKQKAKEQHHSSSYLINLISPSPTKTLSSNSNISGKDTEQEPSPISATSPPKRKNSIGTPSRKPKVNLKARDSTPIRKSKGSDVHLSSPSRAYTPVSSKNHRRAQSPALSSASPLSFMKSTASSRNSTYAALAASSSSEAAAMYMGTPKRTSLTPSKPKSNEKSPPAMQEWKNLVATITPSPPPPPPTQQVRHQTQGQINLSQDFDTIDLLATMQKKKSSQQQDSRQSSPLRSSQHHRKATSYDSPIRKPWIPSSITPKKSDNTFFKDESLSPISKRKQFLRHNTHQKHAADVSSPAPFAAKPAPYIASPPPAPKPSALLKQQLQLPKPPVEECRVWNDKSSVSDGNLDTCGSLSMSLNGEVLFASSKLAQSPSGTKQDEERPMFSSNSSITQGMDSRTEEMNAISNTDDVEEETCTTAGFANTTTENTDDASASIYVSHNINNDTDDNVVGNLMMMMNMTSTSNSRLVAPAVPSSPQHSTSSLQNESFSLVGFPSPLKSAHGFPIQSKPRSEISNPVCIMLENDYSCDLNMVTEEESVDLFEQSVLSRNNIPFADERGRTPTPPMLSNGSLLDSPSHSPFRYICDDPFATKTVSMLIRPVPSPVTSPEASPRNV